MTAVPARSPTPITTALVVCAVAILPMAPGCSLWRDTTCEDLQQLAADVRGLTELDLFEVGTDGLEDQLDRIEVSWKKVLRSAGVQFGSELRALQSSVDGLMATLRSATSGGVGLTEVIPHLQQDVAAVEKAWKVLTTAVSEELSGCDLGWPTNELSGVAHAGVVPERTVPCLPTRHQRTVRCGTRPCGPRADSSLGVGRLWGRLWEGRQACEVRRWGHSSATPPGWGC